jgi:hypothetical protein
MKRPGSAGLCAFLCEGNTERSRNRLLAPAGVEAQQNEQWHVEPRCFSARGLKEPRLLPGGGHKAVHAQIG